ncbi:hypothetical protein LguiA_012584 [Lonicera macranthoides]
MKSSSNQDIDQKKPKFKGEYNDIKKHASLLINNPFGNVFGECFLRMFSENENEKMNSPRTKIVKTFSENENSENEDCKTENGENIILAFLRFML